MTEQIDANLTELRTTSILVSAEEAVEEAKADRVILRLKRGQLDQCMLVVIIDQTVLT